MKVSKTIVKCISLDLMVLIKFTAKCLISQYPRILYSER